MITKAIIEAVNPDGFHYKVRIPVLHKIENVPGATPYDELPTASCSTMAGISPNLSIGDVVWVSFENDQYSDPVITGILHNEKSANSTSSLRADSLVVEVNAEIPGLIDPDILNSIINYEPSDHDDPYEPGDIDSALSNTSKNAVQNKVIKEALDNKVDIPNFLTNMEIEQLLNSAG